MRVLNVGGASKTIPIPPHYAGWEHLLLDIDPRGEPDIVCDARELTSLPPAQFDAVYCSHNLEHYYRYDGRRVRARPSPCAEGRRLRGDRTFPILTRC